jgi:cell division protein FtsB
LDKRIKALQSDPKAIEDKAREMGLAYPGELIYTSPEKDSKKDQAPPGPRQSPAK